jgi:hypothetical protein
VALAWEQVPGNERRPLVLEYYLRQMSSHCATVLGEGREEHLRVIATMIIGIEGVAASTPSIASFNDCPVGNLPSVSTVKLITTGIPAALPARVISIASSTSFIVSAVTMSASVWQNKLI